MEGSESGAKCGYPCEKLYNHVYAILCIVNQKYIRVGLHYIVHRIFARSNA